MELVTNMILEIANNSSIDLATSNYQDVINQLIALIPQAYQDETFIEFIKTYNYVHVDKGNLLFGLFGAEMLLEVNIPDLTQAEYLYFANLSHRTDHYAIEFEIGIQNHNRKQIYYSIIPDSEVKEFQRRYCAKDFSTFIRMIPSLILNGFDLNIE
jgi:hypothetical protein